jgi:hypothetical protein
MINRSLGGACVRLRRAVAVGTKVRVQWRWDQFTGVTRYCRSEGREFLVGIQRELEQQRVEEKKSEQKMVEQNVIEPNHAEQKVLPQEILARAVEKRSLETRAAMQDNVERRKESAVREAVREKQPEHSRAESKNTETKQLGETVSKAEPSRTRAEVLQQALGAIASRSPMPKTEEFAVLQETERQERRKLEENKGRGEGNIWDANGLTWDKRAKR